MNRLRLKHAIPAAAFALTAMLLLSGCSTPKIKYIDPVVAKARISEPLLLITPLNPDASLQKEMQYLGKAYLTSINNRVSGQITYAGSIESLQRDISPDNLITNGVINTKEVAMIGKTLGCNSAVTIRVIQFKQYPPFRMVVELSWIDCLSGNTMARLYEDIDMTDSETDYRFSNFVGDGPARTAYESFAYYKALSPTASLKPTDFMRFVAAYSSRILFDRVDDSDFSWRFWRIF